MTDRARVSGAPREEVRRNAIRFLNRDVVHLWPEATRRAGEFRWELLVDPNGRPQERPSAEGENAVRLAVLDGERQSVRPLRAVAAGQQRLPHLAARPHLRQPDHRRRLDRLRLQRRLRRGGGDVRAARGARDRAVAALEGHRRLRSSVKGKGDHMSCQRTREAADPGANAADSQLVDAVQARPAPTRRRRLGRECRPRRQDRLNR